MRLDKFLKVSRVLKRRTVAANACDKNLVSVNGRVAKAGKQLSIGDIVQIEFGNHPLKFEVVKLVASSKKNDAEDMYRVLDNDK